MDTHDPLCRRVTNRTGARVVSVDYRLAPEHPYPAALDDAEEVLHWLRAQDPKRTLGVAGDSAGASLTAGLIHGFAGFLGLVDADAAAVTGIPDRLTRALNT